MRVATRDELVMGMVLLNGKRLSGVGWKLPLLLVMLRGELTNSDSSKRSTYSNYKKMFGHAGEIARGARIHESVPALGSVPVLSSVH